MNFGAILKELRIEQGLTQKELAKKANLATSCVGMIETESREPGARTLIALSNALNVSVDYLLGREDDFGNVTVTNSERDNLTYLERRLLSAFSKLDIDEKDKIISDVEYFAVKHGYIAPTKYAKY